jgi:hypothetical protein
VAPTTARMAGTVAPRAIVSPASLVAAVCAPPAIVLVVLLAVVGVPIVLAVVVPVLLAAAAGWWLVRSADAVAVAGLRLHPATEDDQPRLFNMVDGLCDSHGYRRPDLYVIDADARNALVWGRRAGAPSLAISRGWLESVSLLGLEGLLARELAQANDPALPGTTVAISVARAVPGSLRRRLFARVAGEHRVLLDDFAAVAATRYPPGLADALATQAAGSSLVPGVSSLTTLLWVAPPAADHLLGDAVAPLDIRVDALREL